MNLNELMAEIREANLTYLNLAQRMVRNDRTGAADRLGVSPQMARVLEGLSSDQLGKMAGSNMLVCRFRFDDHVILDMLTRYGKRKPASAAAEAPRTSVACA